MSILNKIGILKRKPASPEQEIDIHITTKQQGKEVKHETLSNVPNPIIKPYVHDDEQSLQESLRGGNGNKGIFKERPPKAGVQAKATTSYDRDRLSQMLAMDVNPDQRQIFTVTPKEHNIPMVIGDMFNEIAALGEERDLSDPEQTAWGIFSKHRDLRAPSTWPEPGDNRNAIKSVIENIAEQESGNSFMKMGGG